MEGYIVINEKFIFTNSKGLSVEFGSTGPFILLSHDGTGSTQADLQLQKNPFLDGQRFTGASLSSRPITLEFLIQTTSQDETFRRRAQLVEIMSAKHGLSTLLYDYGSGTKMIETTVENGPLFPAGIDNRDRNFQMGIVHLLCPNPYFHDTEDVKVDIATWEPLFEFPLEIPQDTGIEMGRRSQSLIVNVFNKGHVPTGMIIQFKALGTLKNPSLFNVNTREYFKINKTMTPGEIITVNTNQGKKRVESNLNGVTTNIFNLMDFKSKFMQLDVGDNLFRYDADTNVESLEVSIYFTPQYLGV